MADLPAWARWRGDRVAVPWSVGLEEEVVLCGPDGEVANDAAEAIAALPPWLAARASLETHACVLELKTGPHPTVAGAGRELAALRGELAGALASRLGLRAFAAGTHPLAEAADVRIGAGARQRAVARTTRVLAGREPTMALHVHVGVPGAQAAVHALDGLRERLPLLLALGANSPYWRGADSGFASMRTPLFGAFPRVGIPRRFGTYAAYVEVVERMLRTGVVPEPGFLWWDARLRPALGTVEVRVADAQLDVVDAVALAALVQCLVRRHAGSDPGAGAAREILDENRFLAARDGIDAALLDHAGRRRREARELLAELLAGCAATADALGCATEVATAGALARDPGHARQRRLAAVVGAAGLPTLLADRYAGTPDRAAPPAATAAAAGGL
ncbi:MAG TPA: YbdK family carboxylate-amine ligase [Capillimicrobium sp.]|nr:YbdK family carboxylate-amine ligase [Capillimicrobium sp.]